MSYDHNIYVGHYAKVRVPKGQAPRAWHALEDTQMHGTPEDKITCKGCYAICPEFLEHHYVLVMLNGYVSLKNIHRKDSEDVPFTKHSDLTSGFQSGYHETFMRIFKGATEVTFHYGMIHEVV